MPTKLDLRKRLRLAASRDEGQTMAEYGVTMAVITVALLALFTALSGGIQGALNRVIAILPS